MKQKIPKKAQKKLSLQLINFQLIKIDKNQHNIKYEGITNSMQFQCLSHTDTSRLDGIEDRGVLILTKYYQIVIKIIYILTYMIIL